MQYKQYLLISALIVLITSSPTASSTPDDLVIIQGETEKVSFCELAPDPREITLEWYRSAAEQGDAYAQCVLGVLHVKDNGVPKDDAEAVKWYRLAAKQGHAAAQYNLGLMYNQGRGVIQNDNVAMKWFRLAAGQGLAVAQNYIGIMYGDGLGVMPSDTEAVKWFRLAAEQGYAGGQHSLGYMYDVGRGVKDDSEEWKYYLDEEGRGRFRRVTWDYTEAVKWYRLAAKQGHAIAQNNLGYLYLYRLDPRDDAEALKWFRLSAEQGYTSGVRIPVERERGFWFIVNTDSGRT